MKTSLHHIFVLLLSAVLTEGVCAQDGIANFGLSSGLSNGFVRSLTQDAKGFVWVATEEGLNRFDGQGFVVFNTSNSSLAANELNFIAPDPTDSLRLWIATQRNGLQTLDLSTGEIANSTLPNLQGQEIMRVDKATGKEGGVWLTNYHHGIQYYDSTLTHPHTYGYMTMPGLPGRCWTMADPGNGKIYIGHDVGGLSVVDTLSHTFVNYRHDSSDPSSLSGESVYALLIDTGGDVWIGTEHGVSLFNPVTERFINFVYDETDPNSIGPGRVYDIERLENGEIWFATSEGGISILDSKKYAYSDISSASFRRLPHNGTAGGTSSSSARCIYQDSFGNIWIGNYRNGVDVISHGNALYNKAGLPNAAFSGLSGAVWSSCADSKGNLWFGGEGYVIRVSNESAHTYPLPHDSRHGNTEVKALGVDRYDNLWLAVKERGVMVLTPGGQFISTGIDDPDVRVIYRDHDGRMLIGGFRGVHIAERGKDGRVKSESLDSINTYLPDRLVQALLRDSEGNLWVGTFGKGIAIFDPSNRLIATIGTSNGLPSHAVNDIMTDSNGRIWITTRGGIVRADNVDSLDSLFVMDRFPRLGSVNIKAIEEDELGNLWISSNSGVARLDFVNEEPIVYSYSGQHMQPLNSFFEGASTRDTAGNIYFASTNGVYMFSPSKISPLGNAPQVVLTSFTVYGGGKERRRDEGRRIIASDKIELPYDRNSFELSFGTLDYAMVDRTDFTYRMEGVDDLWLGAPDNNTVIYRNLPPGKYNFEIRQRQIGGDWSEPIRLIAVKINPPLWLTWWAKLLYVMIFGGLLTIVFLIYRHREGIKQNLKSEMERIKNNESLNEERLRFYTNVTHELRTPLTLILGPLEDMLSDPLFPVRYAYKLQVIRDSSTRLLDLINHMLEFRKTETQNRSLNVARRDMGNLVREIALRFKELNRNPKVAFKIDIEPGLTPLYFDIDMVTTILNNLLSNAVKYTQDGSITVSLHNVTEEGIRHTVLSVEDTGYGISKENQKHIFDRYYQVNGPHQASGTGIGLALVKSLVELHQAVILVESAQGKGTKFTVSFLTDCVYPGATHDEAKPEQVTPQKVDQEDNDTRRLTLLVVEDNDDIRDYIRESLSNEFDVITAVNGLDGLRKAQENEPDIIISDIMMPEMDGNVMCKTLKEDILTSHIPIILLTAKDSLTDREEGYDSGADSYLTKPFSVHLLRARIHNILKTRRRVAAKYMEQTVLTPPLTRTEELSPDDKPAEDPTNTLSPLDRKFMEKINATIEENLALEELSVVFIAEKMCMSQSTLYRKIMAITGVSTNEYVRHKRLNRAARLLQDGDKTLTEIAFGVGFGSTSSFSKAFKKEFGVSPSEYVKGSR